MQPLTAPPRGGLAGGDVTRLVEASDLVVDVGCELLDDEDGFIEDISDDLEAAGEVERANFRTVHATCKLRITRDLQWGWQRLKPYVTLSSVLEGVSARFDLGVYVLSTPVNAAGRSPRTFEVEGYDKLQVLVPPLGATHAVEAGTLYLDAVEQLIVEAGESKVLLDQSAAEVVLPTDRVWELDPENTRLKVINELLAAVGYRGLWVDEQGFYRSEPDVSLGERPVEWTYDATSATTTVGLERTETRDFFEVPNRWVFVRDDPEAGLPVEGDGIYTVTNQSDGDTSIDGRRRVITRVERLDVASHASLVSRGDLMVEADKRLIRYVEMQAGPNPLHGHFDTVRLVDPELGVSSKYQVTDWRLPLDGGDMFVRMRRFV